MVCSPLPDSNYYNRGMRRGHVMITIDQARDNLDQILQAVRLTREEHQVLGSCLELLYDGAKEAEESKQTAKIIPIREVCSEIVQ